MLELDDKITIFLNSFHTEYWDGVMFVFSGQLFWLPLATAIIYALVRTYGKQVYIPLIFIALIILAADQISSGVFKPFFERLRPSRDPDLEGMIHNVHGYRGGMYGFVSSHAANALAFATFSALLMRNKVYSAVILSWATVTAYSRVYLGVHFFGDILAGGILGVCIGFIFIRILQALHKTGHFATKEPSTMSVNIVLVTYIISLLVLVLYSKYLIFML